MFAPKQKAFTLPTIADLNILWSQARSKIGINNYQSATNVIDFSTHRTNDDQCQQEYIQTQYIDVDIPQANTRRSAFNGDLSQIQTSSLLQALALSKITGSLKVAQFTDTQTDAETSSNDVITGAISFWQGRITRAQWDCFSGREALSEIILLKNGSFTFESDYFDSFKNKALPLQAVLIEAALKEDQLAILHSEADLSNITIVLPDKLVVPDKAQSQWALCSKFVRQRGHKHIVFCQDIIKRLRDGQLTLASLKLQMLISDAEIIDSVAILVRSGLVELYKTTAKQKQDALQEDSKNLAQAAAFAYAYQTSSKQLELIDSANSQLQAMISKNSPTAFVFIRGVLSHSAPRLLAKIKQLLRHEDAVHKVDDDQLLVVMKATNSTEAARFVNRLRTQGGTDLLTVVSTNKDQEALSLYHTAVVSAPEDGDSVNVLFDRAHLAFNVNKRVGVKSGITAKSHK